TAKLIRKGGPGKPHEIYLGVTDSGVGISKEGQQKIFDAFSQADKSVSRKFGGTGLGLAISKGLVEAMGSNIGINSNEGEGSTFFFTVDMDDAAREEETTSSEAPEIHEHHKRPMSILIVDDNDVNQKVITGFLQKSPHKLDTAKTAEDALTKVDINPYDIILMDIELPGMNGDEATQKIRSHKDKKIAQTLVIALTGNVMQDDIDTYLKSGMNDALAKPIKPNVLNDALDKVVTGHYTKQDKPKTQTPKEEKPAIFDSIPDTPTPSTPVEETVPPAPSTPFEQPQTPAEETPAVQNAAPQPEEQSAPAPVRSTVTRVSRAKKRVSSNTSLSNTTPQQASTNEYTSDQPAFDNDILDALKGHLDAAQIQDMLEEVFTKSVEIISALEQAYQNKDPKEAYARAHELKGMTGNFGLAEISDIATQIETLAKDENILHMDPLVAQIPTALAKARAAADEWLAS
ncbi:MAG: response regulator, partial [Alphaproteobacteria bacterium]|nr:response regulator [Alphaproteobacteria bacterium]